MSHIQDPQAEDISIQKERDKVRLNNSFLSQWRRYVPVIGLILFAYVLYKLDLQLLLSTIRKIDYWWLLSLPVIVFSSYLVQTIRLQFILRTRDIQLPFWRICRIQLIGLFYGTITPGKIGGMIKIGYLAKSSDKSVAKCSTSVFIERFLDLISLLFFGLGGSVVITSTYYQLKYQLGLLLILLLGMGLFFHGKKRTKILVSYIKKLLPLSPQLSERLEIAFEDFYGYIPRKRETIIPFTLCLINWGFLYGGAWIIARSLDIHIPYWQFALVYSLATIVGLLPITISGLGTRETALILLFGNYGLSPEEIVSISIVSVILWSVMPALLGWLLSIAFPQAKATKSS